MKPCKLPKISIITPSFNQGQFIEETICSVLNQNYPNLEYIIIDGGSTDNSVDIIKKYEDQLAYWVSEPDQGHYDAVNKGFKLASGEIMGFINSDDMLLPSSLFTIASVFSTFENIEWISSNQPGFIDSQGTILPFINRIGFSKYAFFNGYHLGNIGKSSMSGTIQQESTFWRKSLWEKAGGRINVNYHLAGDFDLWCRFYEYADLYGINSPIACFRKQENQRSRLAQKGAYLNEALESLSQQRKKLGIKRNPLILILNNYLFFIKRIPLIRRLISYFGFRFYSIEKNNNSSQWVIKINKTL